MNSKVRPKAYDQRESNQIITLKDVPAVKKIEYKDSSIDGAGV